MNIILIGAIIFVVVAVVYKVFFNKNGGTVYAEMYELNGGNLVRLNPKGNIKCSIKKQDNTPKLFLPKKYTNNEKQGIEIPKSSDYILNYPGIRLIKVIKVNENEFKLAKPQLIVSDGDYKLKFKPIERDISFWADNEQLRINHEWTTESTWDKIRPFAIISVAAIVALIMVGLALDKVGELADDAKEDRTAMTTLIAKLMDDPGSVANNLQEKQNDNKEILETETPTPPGNPQ